MREVLGVQIDLESLDGALDAGALLVAGVVASEVLGVVPVDLREVLALDPDVPARALLQAAVGERTTDAHAIAVLVVWGCPDVGFNPALVACAPELLDPLGADTLEGVLEGQAVWRDEFRHVRIFVAAHPSRKRRPPSKQAISFSESFHLVPGQGRTKFSVFMIIIQT